MNKEAKFILLFFFLELFLKNIIEEDISILFGKIIDSNFVSLLNEFHPKYGNIIAELIKHHPEEYQGIITENEQEFLSLFNFLSSTILENQKKEHINILRIRIIFFSEIAKWEDQIIEESRAILINADTSIVQIRKTEVDNFDFNRISQLSSWRKIVKNLYTEVCSWDRDEENEETKLKLDKHEDGSRRRRWW